MKLRPSSAPSRPVSASPPPAAPAPAPAATSPAPAPPAPERPRVDALDGLLGLRPEPALAGLSAPADAALEAALLAGGSSLAEAHAALQATRRMTLVPTPARFRLKESKSTPPVIEGYVRRSSTGPKDAPVPKVLFVTEGASYPIPPEAVEGLPNGGRAELRLEPGGEYRAHLRAEDRVPKFLGQVVERDGRFFAVATHPMSPIREAELGALAAPLVGQAALVDILHPAGPTIVELIGKPDGPRARLLASALAAGAEVGHPPDVMAEIAAIVKDPKIEGPDLTHLPFVTIDNEDSKDLDQALYFERRADGGFVVHYAIADAAHFVPEGSALDRVAKRRSSTVYLPDRNLPMLPRELSEDLCSLLPDVNRRALVVSIPYDASGQPIETDTDHPRFQRGVIRSRAKLSYDGVQRDFDQKKRFPTEVHQSLESLLSWGKLRIADAEVRGVVPSEEGELRVSIGDGEQVSVHRRVRNLVERCNEQVSLAVNSAVGRFLSEAGFQSLHRVHPEPEPSRLASFRAQVEALGFPQAADESLAAYLRRLDPADPRTAAIQRLATRTNRAAEYSTTPGGHHGLKLDHYDHFTAPMRRYPDIVVHRILAAAIEGSEPPHQAPGALDGVARRAGFARRRDGEIAEATQAVVRESLLAGRDAEILSGVVTELGPGGLTVRLAEPPLEVKVRTATLNRAAKTGAHTLDESATALSGPLGTFRLGAPIALTLGGRDPKTGELELRPADLTPSP